MSARQVFQELLPGPGYNPLNGVHRTALHEDAIKGVEALAALYFDEYEDETELPVTLTNLVRFMDDLGLTSDLYDEAMNGDTDE
jgi:hypothetical protein